MKKVGVTKNMEIVLEDHRFGGRQRQRNCD